MTVPAPPPAAEPTPALDAGTDRASHFGNRNLELRWVRAWNLHHGGHSGASHENSRGHVTLKLDARGKASAVDAGKREESVLSGNRYTQTVTDWSFTWRGTWSTESGAPRVKLERENAACTITETERQGTQQFRPTVSTCPLASRELDLVCETDGVDADPSSDDLTADPTPTPVWVCFPTEEGVATSGTPFAWVFGHERCLEQAGGGRGMPMRYVFCAP